MRFDTSGIQHNVQLLCFFPKRGIISLQEPPTQGIHNIKRHKYPVIVVSGVSEQLDLLVHLMKRLG